MHARLTTETFIEKARSVHGDKYDYSKVNYVGSDIKVEIVCPEHGSFFQTPKEHLRGRGCLRCAITSRGLKRRMTTEEFVNKYYTKYPNSRYDLSETVYATNRKCVTAICPIHGRFKIKANHLLQGCGCQKCTMSQLEKKTQDCLKKLKCRFSKYKHFQWLGLQSLDFYLPELKIAIECQGDQHFRAIEHFGGEEKLRQIVERDERKKRLCEENGVKLIYLLDEDNRQYMTNNDTFFTDTDDLSSWLIEQAAQTT